MDMTLPSSLIITKLFLLTTLLPLTSGHDTYLYQNSNIPTAYFHNDSIKGHEDNSFLGAIGRLIFGEESKRFLRNFTTSELPGLALSAVNSFGSHNSFKPQLPTTSAVVPDNRHHYRYQSNQNNYASYPLQNLAGSPATPCTYYNPSRLRCELFYWSGCCGNANNFATHQSCEQLCENVDRKPNSIVYVPFTLTFTMRPTDGPPSQQTKQIRPILPPEPSPPNNGVENNINELISMQYKPEAVTNRERMGGNSVLPPPLSLVTNKCELDLDAGHGGPPQKRYYFNPLTKLCQEFQFGGQGGNPNNFVNFGPRNIISYFLFSESFGRMSPGMQRITESLCIWANICPTNAMSAGHCAEHHLHWSAILPYRSKPSNHNLLPKTSSCRSMPTTTEYWDWKC
ncbi:kunitz/Bovine pancreatic trypsin inhibitor domain-containing protein [Ditylenchus destructor]|nr:kunitz/Bovine pancreatic trypsin inhibitor domain-containing protein [Ditylenchus destructor]